MIKRWLKFNQRFFIDQDIWVCWMRQMVATISPDSHIQQGWD